MRISTDILLRERRTFQLLCDGLFGSEFGAINPEMFREIFLHDELTHRVVNLGTYRGYFFVLR